MRNKKIRNKIISNVLAFSFLSGLASQVLYVDRLHIYAAGPLGVSALKNEFEEGEALGASVINISNYYVLRKLDFKVSFPTEKVYVDEDNYIKIYQSVEEIKAELEVIRDEVAILIDSDQDDARRATAEKIIKEKWAKGQLEGVDNKISVWNPYIESIVSDNSAAISEGQDKINEWIDSIDSTSATIDHLDDINNLIVAIDITEAAVKALSKANATAPANSNLLDLSTGSNGKNLEKFFKSNPEVPLNFKLVYKESENSYKAFKEYLDLADPDKTEVGHAEYAVKYIGSTVNEETGTTTLNFELWVNIYGGVQGDEPDGGYVEVTTIDKETCESTTVYYPEQYTELKNFVITEDSVPNGFEATPPFEYMEGVTLPGGEFKESLNIGAKIMSSEEKELGTLGGVEENVVKDSDGKGLGVLQADGMTIGGAKIGTVGKTGTGTVSITSNGATKLENFLLKGVKVYDDSGNVIGKVASDSQTVVDAKLDTKPGYKVYKDTQADTKLIGIAEGIADESVVAGVDGNSLGTVKKLKAIINDTGEKVIGWVEAEGIIHIEIEEEYSDLSVNDDGEVSADINDDKQVVGYVLGVGEGDYKDLQAYVVVDGEDNPVGYVVIDKSGEITGAYKSDKLVGYVSADEVCNFEDELIGGMTVVDVDGESIYGAYEFVGILLDKDNNLRYAKDSDGNDDVRMLEVLDFAQEKPVGKVVISGLKVIDDSGNVIGTVADDSTTVKNPVVGKIVGGAYIYKRQINHEFVGYLQNLTLRKLFDNADLYTGNSPQQDSSQIVVNGLPAEPGTYTLTDGTLENGLKEAIKSFFVKNDRGMYFVIKNGNEEMSLKNTEGELLSDGTNFVITEFSKRADTVKSQTEYIWTIKWKAPSENFIEQIVVEEQIDIDCFEPVHYKLTAIK